MKVFYITKLADFFNKEDQKIFVKNERFKTNPPNTNEHPYLFKAYDDDGELYFTGTCKKNSWEKVFDWCQWDSGCTLVKFYDRKTKKYIDAIG